MQFVDIKVVLSHGTKTAKHSYCPFKGTPNLVEWLFYSIKSILVEGATIFLKFSGVQ